MKKCLNKCAHIPVYATEGAGASMEMTGKLIWLSGTYIRDKSEDAHAWIDETIEIGKEEISKQDNQQ